jgi:hypothetical protein
MQLVATILVLVDVDDTFVCNLSDLGEDYVFNPELLAYCRLYPDRITKKLYSPIHFSLTVNNNIVNDDNLIIDNDLNVRTKTPMLKNNSYRLYVHSVREGRHLKRDAELDVWKYKVFDDYNVLLNYVGGCRNYAFKTHMSEIERYPLVASISTSIKRRNE